MACRQQFRQYAIIVPQIPRRGRGEGCIARETARELLYSDKRQQQHPSLPIAGNTVDLLITYEGTSAWMYPLFSLYKKKSRSDLSLSRDQMKGGVVPPGIEPGTHGFSVRCSTN